MSEQKIIKLFLQEVFATLSVKWNLIQKQHREKCGRGGEEGDIGEGGEGGYSGYIKGKSRKYPPTQWTH